MARSISVTHLRHVVLAVPQYDASRRFFTAAWGLDEVTGDGAECYLRTLRAEPFQLVLVAAERRSLVRLALGVPTPGDVDAAVDILRENGLTVTALPDVLRTPGGGYGLRFTDPDGRCVELSAGVEGVAGEPREAVPAYLSHIVMNTPDLEAATHFYREVLGFRLSDRSETVMTFLRCDREHHAVAFNQAPHSSLNHLSWQINSLDEFFRAQGRVRAAGTPLAWGTGRHAPGRQVFNYFVEPSGFVMEYVSDGVAIDDEANWTPQVFRREPAAMDIWNTAGPPSPEIRAAMLDVPDPHAIFAQR
jgi:catechol 2,3-dioxygenase-like lactoylglutathione lyase family enzyme